MLPTPGSVALFGLFCLDSVLAGCSDKSLTTNKPKVINKDVVVIGGGASGAYAAVRLREDYGLTVAVVEKEAQLGGHVNTWVDPATGRGFDAGVQSYVEVGNSTAFFKRFGIETGPNTRPAQQPPQYVDFVTGKRLTNYTLPSTEDRNDALRRYLAVAESVLPVFEPGWWTFPEPNAIPEDLLLSFRDVMVKYNLTSAVPQILGLTGGGIRDFMNSPLMWVMRPFGVDMCRTILGINSGFIPTSGKNQDLYDAVLKLLGSDAFLSSTVVSSKRTDKGVTVDVRNAETCKVTRIIAKKLLFAASPTRENLEPFSLDKTEQEVLHKFQFTRPFVGVVSHPSLPLGASITNMPEHAQGGNWTAAADREFPYASGFNNFANSSYFRTIVGGDTSLTEKRAREILHETFDRLVAAGTITQTGPPQPLQILYFKNHYTMNAHVSNDAIRSGFVQRLNSLQGRRSTWYTGSAWSVPITTSLWVFTDTVLPKLVDSL
ncbi:hypothetical protein QBC34DRAFT_313374 [Podospora aff. communis PSN243]|uniref:Amine oxidase n=1 Tax=Podospora aff. communis PSN243 TaxID=3040156 RepID=A0AAV9G1H4_9PEZI|nr:hypothetical protein QBC34DRAFT_313374 [Podospora aff. communis PSN243]